MNQTAYQALLVMANMTATGLPTRRLVITLPDGTVVVDTAKTDGSGAAVARRTARRRTSQ